MIQDHTQAFYPLPSTHYPQQTSTKPPQPPILPSAINGAWEPQTRRHKWRLSEED